MPNPRIIRAAAVALAVLLVPAAAQAKKQKVLVLQVQSDALGDTDKAAGTTAVRDALAKYPNVELLDTPRVDFLELMLEAECVDVDGACLAAIGKKFGASHVVYVEAEPADAGVGLKFSVVKVRSKKATPHTGTAASKADLGAALGKLVVAGFGAAATPKPKPKPKPKPARSVPIVIGANVDGANVYINGDLAGRTPLKARLRPGKYKVRLSRDGYKDAEQPFVVQKGKKATLNVEMQKVSAVAKPDPVFPPPDKEPDDVTPIYKEWWFWTTIGVVVAGGVTAAVLLSREDEPAPTGVMNFGFGSPDYDPLVLEAAQ